MTPSTPVVVAHYLRSLPSESRSFAYLGLDEGNRIRVSGGQLHFFGLDVIDNEIPVCAQFDVLEGLLPSGGEPVVIKNTQFNSGNFVDLHLFSGDDGQWVLFLDNTEPGRHLQAKQQKRLEGDILMEKKLRLKN